MSAATTKKVKDFAEEDLVPAYATRFGCFTCPNRVSVLPVGLAPRCEFCETFMAPINIGTSWWDSLVPAEA